MNKWRGRQLSKHEPLYYSIPPYSTNATHTHTRPVNSLSMINGHCHEQCKLVFEIHDVKHQPKLNKKKMKREKYLRKFRVKVNWQYDHAVYETVECIEIACRN